MLYQPSGILESVYQRAGLESICKIRIINEFYYEKEAANTRPLSFIRYRRFLPVCRRLHLLRRLRHRRLGSHRHLLRQGVCAFL